MGRTLKPSLFALGVVVLMNALPTAQAPQEKKERGRAIVSLYNIAPGKHVDFIKWMAAREAVDQEAGLPATRWYGHISGASWDFISIAPATTPEQDAKVDELAKQKGLTTGAKAAVEIRQFISSHTDTLVIGPFTAAEIVQEVSGK
jgi:hypothetical protein